jgi:hypothetical protein
MSLTILAVIPSKGTLIVLLSAGFLIQQHVRFVTRQRKISSISSFSCVFAREAWASIFQRLDLLTSSSRDE